MPSVMTKLPAMRMVLPSYASGWVTMSNTWE